MITLKQAIQLLDLNDDEIIYICKKHYQSFADSYSVRDIRNKFDMKNTIVKKIYPNHFAYSADLDWEFII